MSVKIKVKSLAKRDYVNSDLPKYATPASSGVDVRADLSRLSDNIGDPQYKVKLGENNVIEAVVVPAHQRVLIPTGLCVEIPEGFEIQVRPRSGLALKNGITVLNTPGTIDASYRGEIGVILMNHSDVDFYVNDGDRIAQLVLTTVEEIIWIEEKLTDTKRGTGGFGSTGVS